MKRFFVTGTDTDVGKTWATIALMRHLQTHGLIVNAMKPVAAGCVEQDGIQHNADADLMQVFGSVGLSYQQINPYAFIRGVSPHLACEEQRIDLSFINDLSLQNAVNSDVLLIEGAGGWYSPLDRDSLNADLAVYLNQPVILVVGIRLGCINHALLTCQAIQDAGVKIAAWVGVVRDPNMDGLQSTIEYLYNRLQLPWLGVLPFIPWVDFEFLAEMIGSDVLKN